MNDGADKKLLWREKKKTLKKTRQRRLLRVVYATKQVSADATVVLSGFI